MAESEQEMGAADSLSDETLARLADVIIAKLTAKEAEQLTFNQLVPGSSPGRLTSPRSFEASPRLTVTALFRTNRDTTSI